MPRTRGERGGGTLGAAINGPGEEDKTNDVEDGLREPLLSRHDDGDAGDGDNSGRAAETENDDTAAAAVTEKEAGPETKPSSFIDLFFFADRVSRGVTEGQSLGALVAVSGQDASVTAAAAVGVDRVVWCSQSDRCTYHPSSCSIPYLVPGITPGLWYLVQHQHQRRAAALVLAPE